MTSSRRQLAAALLLVLTLLVPSLSAETIVWRTEDTGTTGLTSVVGFPDGSAVAVGPGGTVVERTPEGVWNPLSSPGSVDLFDVHGPSSDFFAVAGDGYVGIFDDGVWTDVLTGQPNAYTPVHLAPSGFLAFGVPGQFPSICRFRVDFDSLPLCLVADDWVLGLCGDASPLTYVDRAGDVFTVTDGLTITPVHDSPFFQELAGVDFGPDCDSMIAFRQPTAADLELVGLILDAGPSGWEVVGDEAEFLPFSGVAIEGGTDSDHFSAMVAGADIDTGDGNVFEACSNAPCRRFLLPGSLLPISDVDRMAGDLLAISEGFEAIHGQVFAPDPLPIVTDFDEFPLGNVHGAEGPPRVAVSPVSDANEIQETSPGDRKLVLKEGTTRFDLEGGSPLVEYSFDAFLRCVEGGQIVVQAGSYSSTSGYDEFYSYANLRLTCEMTEGGWRLLAETFRFAAGSIVDSGFLELPGDGASLTVRIVGGRAVVSSDMATLVLEFPASFVEGFERFDFGFEVDGGAGPRGGAPELSLTLERLFVDSALFADGFETGDLSGWAP